jgi:hypothetical protein
MAKNDKREGRRETAAEHRQEQQRLSRLETQVGAMRRESPMPPEQRANAEARERDVAQTMSRLGGRSRSDLVSDAERGPTSGLGMGSHSKPEKERRRR